MCHSFGKVHITFGLHIYRPQTKFAKVKFLKVSVILFTGGACMVAPGGGGHAWFLGGAYVVAPWGDACLLRGVCGCSGVCAWLLPGACMVAPGGHAWVTPGGHAWLLWGACVVALGGMHGCSRVGGHAWLLPGGVHACSRGGMCSCSWGGMGGCSGGRAWFFDEIRSMSGRYASYWNAFLLIGHS